MLPDLSPQMTHFGVSKKHKKSQTLHDELICEKYNSLQYYIALLNLASTEQKE
jgi:hypothetical protein